jgi:hypothetical protein
VTDITLGRTGAPVAAAGMTLGLFGRRGAGMTFGFVGVSVAGGRMTLEFALAAMGVVRE